MNVSEWWFWAKLACDLNSKQNENWYADIIVFYYTQGWDWDLVLKEMINVKGFEKTNVSEWWFYATVACDLESKENKKWPGYITDFYYTQE